MFNESWCFLISKPSNIFLYFLLLYLFRSILKLFGDTHVWLNWSVCLSMCNLLSFLACPIIILSFSFLAVSPKYFSEHVFSRHLTNYVRSCLCSNFVLSFILHEKPSFLLLYTCCAAWFLIIIIIFWRNC